MQGHHARETEAVDVQPAEVDKEAPAREALTGVAPQILE